MKRFAKMFSLILVTMLVFFAGAGLALAGFDDEEEEETTNNVDGTSASSGVLTDWSDQTSDEVQPLTKPLAKNMPYLFLIGGVCILMYYGLKTSTSKKKGKIDDASDSKNDLNHAMVTLIMAMVFIAIFIAFAKGKTVGIM